MGTCCTKSKNREETNKHIDFGKQVDVYINKSGNFYKDIHVDYNFHHIIGTGFFGNVFLGTYKHKSGDMEFAIKKIKKEQVANELHHLKQEIELLMQIDHPNIIKIFECYEDDESIYLVMQHCSGGELFERISQSGSFTEQQASKIMFKLFSAISYLHSANICHRDIKAENVLYETDDYDSDIKIIDFGLARKFGDTSMRSTVGSAFYVAPQVIMQEYGKECDIWSLGVIMYFMLCGNPPFECESKTDTLRLVMKSQYSLEGDIWSQISEEAKDLIRKTIVYDPKERITAQDALNHTWFQQEMRLKDQPLNPKILRRLRRHSASTKLKQVVMTVLVRHLSAEKLKELNQIFRSLDIDNSGYISHEELAVGLQRVGISAETQEIQQIILNADIAGDGQINYTDFIVATMDLKRNYDEEQIKAVFQYFDVDRSGKLGVEDLQMALRKVGIVKTDREINSMFREVGKGVGSFISFNEFKSIIGGGEASSVVPSVYEEN